MGCTSSSSQPGMPGDGPLKLFDELSESLRTEKSLDMRKVTLLVWRARKRPDMMAVVGDLIALSANEKNSFRGIEFYLPQLTHMLVHFELDWNPEVLELFALLVAQQSIHSALELSWLLIGLMEDYQAEDHFERKNPDADPQLYVRCAMLLRKLELSVVFGSPQMRGLEKLFREGKITRAELAEAEVADRRFQAMQISSALEEVHTSSKFSMDGQLEFKRGRKRSGFHRDQWIKRRFVIMHGVLFCLRISDNVIKRSIPLQDCVVEIPESSPVSGKEFYFELREEAAGRKYMLVAESEGERTDWIAALRKAISSPPSALQTSLSGNAENGDIPSGDVAKDSSAVLSREQVAALTPAQVARFGFFRSELDFVRSLTNLCEELRFVDRSKRKEELRARLAKMSIPGCVYIPLCSSTDPWERILGVLPEESTAFSTKERCPCLMTFEVTVDDPETPVDVATYLYQTLGMDGASGDLLDDEIENFDKVGSESGSASSRRALARSKFVRSARNSVTNLDIDTSELQKTTSSGLKTERPWKNEDVLDVWFEFPKEEEIGSADPKDLVESKNGSSENGGHGCAGARIGIKLDRLRDEAITALQTTDMPTSTMTMKSTRASLLASGSEGDRGVYLPALGKFYREEEEVREVEDLEGKLPEESAEALQERDRVESAVLKHRGKLIAKSNDDLRQEVFIMQLIQFLHDIWLERGLKLWIKPYKILSTSQTCGLIEVLQGSTSFDGLKKDNPDEPRIGDYFRAKFTDPEGLALARRNFTESMAGYSAATYVLGIKDRHNGNIMLELETGRIMHIDFGFVLGMAPGKDKIKHTNFSLERAAFKLTPELVDVMGGKKSDNWTLFKELVIEGLMEARKHQDTFVTLVEIMGYRSRLPCFNQPGGGVDRVIRELRGRLMLSLTDAQARKKMDRLIENASRSTGTILYERFQKKSQGIEPALY